MWIKQLFASIWDLVICFLSFFAGFLSIGVIGAMTYGFVFPDVEQVPEPWSTRIVCLALIGGIALAVVVWKKRRRRQNAKSATIPTEQAGMAPLPKAPSDFMSDVHSRAPEALHSALIKEDRDAELRRIDYMEGHEFEHWCAALLRKIGFVNVVVTQGSGDQGVDVLAEKDGIRYAIQCKCYSKDLGNKPVQEVNSGKQMPEYRCQIGAVMTNRYFTKGAKDLAAATGTLLWDRDWIKSQLQTSSSCQNNNALLEAIMDELFASEQSSTAHIQQKFNLDYQYTKFILQTLEEGEFATRTSGGLSWKPNISHELWIAFKQSRNNQTQSTPGAPTPEL